MTYSNPNQSYRQPNPEFMKPTGDPVLVPEMRFNGVWLVGLIINLVITFYALGAYGGVLGGILGGFFTLCLLGTILALSGSGKAGMGLFIVGSIAFVPIGMVGIFGIRKAQDEANAAQFFGR